ncbi:sensor domain-containing diguanylate cyclase [Trinickia dinghuensis]|uniref:diguanylate cyclase n=1 Tax=Trinickia dinghuensis TaxID=2291023 RepID=A0A3D8K681_9BURK|nr:GGDEF domain-containing protein [Trinickia dinghuensis]RDV00563.1 GGDEF domain-containing protein [Trinickia dinghuensis]
MPSLTARRADQPTVFPQTESTSPHARALPAVIAVFSLLVLFAVVPFAKRHLPPVPAFIPVYEAALVVNDLITAVLLFGQCVIARSRAIGVLASGYLYTAAIALLHMLSFPGLFSAAGLLGAGPQSTAWIYMFWHAGFPLFVIAYALLKDGKRDRMSGKSVRVRWLLFCIGTVLAAAGGLALLATAGEHLLPQIMRGNGYTPQMMSVVGMTWGMCLVALAVLWRKRRDSTVDRWLMVVLCVWICDIALSAVFNAGRYDLGFYAGRIYGLLAASFVLLLLLVENYFLQSRLAAALEELKRLATTDPLTGAANRRAFDAALAARLQRAKHDRSPLSLLMIDIDHFKAFNDRYGHLEGDRCLVRVAESLNDAARHGHDLVARYGGEEFAVLLPQTDTSAAASVAQRMCDAVAAMAIPNAGSTAALHVTISVGVASCIDDAGDSSHALVRAADTALYAAKAAGRGRVERTASVETIAG